MSPPHDLVYTLTPFERAHGFRAWCRRCGYRFRAYEPDEAVPCEGTR